MKHPIDRELSLEAYNKHLEAENERLTNVLRDLRTDLRALAERSECGLYRYFFNRVQFALSENKNE